MTLEHCAIKHKWFISYYPQENDQVEATNLVYNIHYFKFSIGQVAILPLVHIHILIFSKVYFIFQK